MTRFATPILLTSLLAVGCNQASVPPQEKSPASPRPAAGVGGAPPVEATRESLKTSISQPLRNKFRSPLGARNARHSNRRIGRRTLDRTHGRLPNVHHWFE